MLPWVIYTGGKPKTLRVIALDPLTQERCNSFKTGRYLGDEGDILHDTRALNCPVRKAPNLKYGDGEVGSHPSKKAKLFNTN